MAEGSRPPHVAMMASAAVGGFFGTILAIVVVKILVGSCCCDHKGEKHAALTEPTNVEIVVAAKEQ